MRAARQTEESYAQESALADYARALEVVERVPEPEETGFGLQAAREHLLEHLVRREEPAKRLGEKPRLAEVHIRRTGVLMTEPDPEGAGRSGGVELIREPGDSAGEARAHRKPGYARWKAHDYAGALESNQAVAHRRSLRRPWRLSPHATSGPGTVCPSGACTQPASLSWT